MKTEIQIHPFIKGLLGWFAAFSWLAGWMLPLILIQQNDRPIQPWGFMGLYVLVCLPGAALIATIIYVAIADYIKERGPFYVVRKVHKPITTDLRQVEPIPPAPIEVPGPSPMPHVTPFGKMSDPGKIH